MADYFLILDADFFEGIARPALAESWRRRDFEPCRQLCSNLTAAAREYTAKYHVADHESLVSRVTAGIPFDRLAWRHLVSEVLLFSAVEIPEIQTCPDTLCCLLAPDSYGKTLGPRPTLAPIQQAHLGSRDLTLGAAIYRPENAGYNNAADVSRLAEFLAQVRPGTWTVADLAPLRDVPEQDKAEELVFAQEWFPALAEIFQRARDHRRVIIHECIY